MESSPRQTEVLILNNPLAYRDVAPDAFDKLMVDGSWIPIVFATLRAVVENHFFELCELNWDYLRDPAKAPQDYAQYKTIYHFGLKEEESRFVESVADEIEETLRASAHEALASKENPDETD